ncbi:unnamed protein product [Aphanomyces euteiches]
MAPEYGSYEKPPRSRKTKEITIGTITEVIDGTEDINPYERDPEDDPDVSPHSMIPPKMQAFESPPTDMKLDGSTPLDNSDEDDPFVASVEKNNDDDTD